MQDDGLLGGFQKLIFSNASLNITVGGRASRLSSSSSTTESRFHLFQCMRTTDFGTATHRRTPFTEKSVSLQVPS